MPELGLGENPTEEEFALRQNLTMVSAAEHEIGGLNLNGYQRTVPSLTIEDTNSYTKIVYKAEFQAYEGTMMPFTHVCLARGSAFSIDPSTGNGRGNSIGQLISVTPVIKIPSSTSIGLTLEAPQKYIAEIPLHITNYTV
jgi:hypothetical protein